MNHEKLKEIQEALPAHVTLVAVSKTPRKRSMKPMRPDARCLVKTRCRRSSANTILAITGT